MRLEFLQSLEAAHQYLDLGLVPLPSRMDKKAPTIEYAHLRTAMPDASVYWDTRWHTTNVQIMTGVNTPGSLKILVVDLDGELAKKAWRAQCNERGYNPVRAWFVKSASGGVHCYYRIPDGIMLCPTRRLWGLWDTWGGQKHQGDWLKHSEVRLLGDNSLVVAPPSRHVRLCEPYKWAGWHHPGFIRVPEDAPDWLMTMPGLVNMTQPVIKRKEYHWQREENDTWPSGIGPARKVELVLSWGLQLTGNLSARRIYCHRINAVDHDPSAIFNSDTGVYFDFVTGESLSFAALSVALGAFPTRKACIESTKT